MFSPAHAHHSPVTLHFLLLVEQLHKQGFAVLDLTAGTDPFKERFASDYDSVQVLSWYANRRVWAKRQVRQQGESLVRRALHAWGIAPHAARLRLQQLLRAPLRTSGAGLARICSPLFRSFRCPAAFATYANGPVDEINDRLPAAASQQLRGADHLEQSQ